MRVLMVTSGWPSPEHPATSIMVAEQVRSLRSEGIEIEVVSYEGATRPDRYLRARRAVRRTLREQPFDLIHAQFGQTGLVVVPSSLPLVMTFHGSDLLGVVGHRGRYTVRGRALQAISRWAARKADRVVIPSERLKGSLPPGVGYDIIRIGVDREVFHPGSRSEARRTLGIKPKDRVVVFGGRPSVPVKRFGLAQEAVERLPPALRPQLRVLENLTRKEMAITLQSADALLVTSKHESGPTIVKEAVACGLPVVSVDVGDVREIIGDLDWCAICRDHPDDLAAELRRLLESPLPPYTPPQELLDRIDQRTLTRRLIAVYRETTASKASGQ